jgi:predicted nucleic acid-binding protein
MRRKHANGATARMNCTRRLFSLDLEIANILWKKVRHAEIIRADADLILGLLPALPLTRHPELPLLTAAFDLADRTQRTVYDSVYLALAVQLGGRMLTADQRLCNSLAGTPWAGNIRWVGDRPTP